MALNGRFFKIVTINGVSAGFSGSTRTKFLIELKIGRKDESGDYPRSRVAVRWIGGRKPLPEEVFLGLRALLAELKFPIAQIKRRQAVRFVSSWRREYWVEKFYPGCPIKRNILMEVGSMGTITGTGKSGYDYKSERDGREVDLYDLLDLGVALGYIPVYNPHEMEEEGKYEFPDASFYSPYHPENDSVKIQNARDLALEPGWVQPGEYVVDGELVEPWSEKTDDSDE
ncbi:hypothetical protein IKG45_02120 [Candidatus Saccharibacteria bacterium]|nr:hypothetical protein [Candidatus Saccharibacteria bacterium]